MSKKGIVFLVCATGLLLLSPSAQATRRTVPAPYTTIQAAINAAVNGDTVLVEDGDYIENITFLGKDITVASHFLLDGLFEHVENTTIEAADSAAVVIFANGETRDAHLVGFTITGGGQSGVHCDGDVEQLLRPSISFCIIDDNYSPAEGGGLLCEYASPYVNNCWITNNEAKDGAGVYLDCQGAHPDYPEFHNCEISCNTAFDGCGGGIYTKENDIRMINCLIVDNAAENEDAKGDGDGGGMYIDDSYWSTYSKMENCVFSGNDAVRGGGLYISGGSSTPTIRNCIFWNNTAEDHDDGPDIYMAASPYVTISWCHVHPDSIHSNSHLIWEGVNPSGNPYFIGDGDYHLSDSSYCIDAGNPDSVYYDPEHPCYSGMAKPSALGTTRNDIGAYGGPGADDWYDMKLLVYPLAWDFGIVSVGEESTMTDTVYNLGIYDLLDLEICDVHTSNPVFEIDVIDSLVSAGEKGEIDITFAPTAVGPEIGTITILTSDGSQAVAVSGSGSGPVLAVAPDTLDFGIVVVGGEAADSFYVLNEGTDSLEICDLFCDSLDFEVEDNTPFTVTPGESIAVVVTFTPQSIGHAEGLVKVISTGAGQDSVGLIGEGGSLSAIEDLMAMKSKDDLYLKWSAVEGATQYRIYRQNEPLFIPSPDDTLAVTAEAQFLDSSAVGDLDTNYYYLVVAANDFIQSPPSNRVGEFDRFLPVGYSLISWPLIVDDTDILLVFADSMEYGCQVTGGYPAVNSDQVKYFETPTSTWYTGWYKVGGHGPQYVWQGDLAHVTADRGYWLIIPSHHEPVILTMTGTVATEDRIIQIEPGPSFNFVGSSFAVACSLGGTTGDDCNLVNSGFMGGYPATNSDKVRYFDGADWHMAWYKVGGPGPQYVWRGTFGALTPGNGYIVELTASNPGFVWEYHFPPLYSKAEAPTAIIKEKETGDMR